MKRFSSFHHTLIILNLDSICLNSKYELQLGTVARSKWQKQTETYEIRTAVCRLFCFCRIIASRQPRSHIIDTEIKLCSLASSERTNAVFVEKLFKIYKFLNECEFTSMGTNSLTWNDENKWVKWKLPETKINRKKKQLKEINVDSTLGGPPLISMVQCCSFYYLRTFVMTMSY